MRCLKILVKIIGFPLSSRYYFGDIFIAQSVEKAGKQGKNRACRLIGGLQRTIDDSDMFMNSGL